MVIEFVLNGERIKADVNPEKRLLHFLREDMGLKGTKEGCGEGECGACSVLLNGKLVHSCLVPLIMVDGRDVLTIEGFRKTERFRVLKEAFSEEGAVQCGFCTPGMLLAAEALLRENPEPDEEDIKEAISGNLCRCTGYLSVVRAIKRASIKGRGLW
ncbi:(2Fe-2S)-binding protein [bacterium]|uniref:(2Fe-2S)-binding protein n=1 Tax=candidate division WOR-3 bacterium TaxID=2052148 RepID=A0A7C0ZF95_UNCW3|nr:MAG: (2Fe-2S)-binding protein [bacterium]HDI83581.1 (2Fe-2S)-binding protein [candidate division WOR-3 bacterium]